VQALELVTSCLIFSWRTRIRACQVFGEFARYKQGSWMLVNTIPKSVRGSSSSDVGF